MCCDLPKARPPSPEWRKASHEDILAMIKPTQAKPQQLKTHRGIPNFLNMHYNHTGHTPGSREEKYLSANEVRLGVGAESYRDWHTRHTEHVKASEKRVATYRNDDGTTTSFEYMKVEIDKVATGTIKADTIAAGSIRDVHPQSSKEERIRNAHWLRTGEWLPSGPVYGHDDDPEGTEYQNYRRGPVPDYAQIMSKKDYEIYTGKLKRPLPQGPEPRYEGYEHDAELASLNIASSLFAIASIGMLILNMMGG